ARRLPALPRRGAVGLRHWLDVGDFNQKRELALQNYLDQVIQGVSSLADEPALDRFFAADAALCRSLSASDVPQGTLSKDVSFESCQLAPKEEAIALTTSAGFRLPFLACQRVVRISFLDARLCNSHPASDIGRSFLTAAWEQCAPVRGTCCVCSD
ncbi:unnamed protein product, partial [Prorocentrum cordatum]